MGSADSRWSNRVKRGSVGMNVNLDAGRGQECLAEARATPSALVLDLTWSPRSCGRRSGRFAGRDG
jgi:hypothetical protein